MRVAITHPTCWPYVRRGSERLLHDLSQCLAKFGHQVTVISGTPGPAAQERDGDVTRILIPLRNPLPFAGRWLTSFHIFGWHLWKHLRVSRYDAVFCLNYHDAAAACAAQLSGAKFRIIFQCTGIPVRRYFRRIPHDGILFKQAVKRADAVVTLSRFASEALQRDFGIAGTLLPSPVETETFNAARRSQSRMPVILFAGDADEPRKGALLLAKAYTLLHSKVPNGRLVYSGNASDSTRKAIMAAVPEPLRQNIEFLGIGRVDDLPEIYGSASVCVNPAVWEALGNVLIEALAAGTPVVGCRHGGIPDIIDDPRIGVMFDPGPFSITATNAPGLADAIMKGLALSLDPATSALCRKRAECFSWRALGSKYEALLRSGLPESHHSLEAPSEWFAS